MVIWFLSISRRHTGPGIAPRWGLLLVGLWMGGLLGCPAPGLLAQGSPRPDQPPWLCSGSRRC